MVQKNGRTFYTSTEAAKLLNLTAVTVRLRARKLGLERTGRDWLFSEADLIRLRNAPDGRRKKRD